MRTGTAHSITLSGEMWQNMTTLCSYWSFWDFFKLASEALAYESEEISGFTNVHNCEKLTTSKAVFVVFIDMSIILPITVVICHQQNLINISMDYALKWIEEP